MMNNPSSSSDRPGAPARSAQPADIGTAHDGSTAAASAFYTADSASLTQEKNVSHLMRQVQTSMNRLMDSQVLPLGLTAMQWRPLVLMRYRQVNTSAEMARLMHVDAGAMTRTLDRLEAKGFIARHRCADDRRVVILTLTDAGKQAAAQILPAAAHTLNSHLTDFSDDEVHTLIDFLNRMLVNGTVSANETPI